MMSFPLSLVHVLERAGRLFASREIATRLPDRSLYRHTYGDFYRRTRRLALALTRLGLRRGDRVATLMWNHHVHLEAYFAVPCAGGVLHTLNLRLHHDDISYIMNHAGDRFLIVDESLLPLYEKVRVSTPLERVIVVTSGGASLATGYYDYESVLADADDTFQYPPLDELDAAGMCYTSGTTGRPKGVVYTHRSIVLHSLASALTDSLGLSNRDTVCPVVPMFHVNAWGLPFSCVLVGARQVFPGPFLDGASLVDLFRSEQVTFSAGVPTIWQSVLEELDRDGAQGIAGRLRTVVGGAAAPESMIRAYARHDIEVIHGWGMTEMSPIGTICFVKHGLAEGDDKQSFGVRAKQGMPLPFVEVRIMAESNEAPWDGVALGELQVRGPWVANGYHDLAAERDKWTADGWFRTGDVACIDAEGYVKICDRIKDLIKSGGEWISSVDLENALAAHPAVREAAVIAVPDPKWDERPLAVLVLKEGRSVTPDELRDYLAGRVARFWVPDAFVFVQEIPRTSTGKMLKEKLRTDYRDGLLVR